MARLLLGVSGGVAAYKALETARLAIKRGHSVRVIETLAAERFVGRASFEAISGAPVLGSEFDPDPARGAFPGDPVPERTPISHLALAQRADLYLIAPATANTLAKLAHGHADNLLTASALAAACPVAVAPAMNNRMYSHPAMQRNLELLEAQAITVIPPRVGELGSHGEYGIGRLAEPADLLDACEALLTAPTLAGLRFLITAGGTREPIDPVRYIGNRSSGRMGVAVAQAAAARGAEVTLVAANLGVEPAASLRTLTVQTASELAQVCRRELPRADVVVMAAAVADFRPAHPAPRKLRKSEGIPSSLGIEATEDVIAELARERRPGQMIVGFAAEHGPAAVERGREKLVRKGLDAIVVNDISRSDIGFEVESNEVTIITVAGERHVARAPKASIAAAILDQVQALLEARHGTERADIAAAS